MNKGYNEHIILKAVDITKKFKLGDNNTLTACDHINMEFSRGEIYGIVGESGCGKSTFSNIMSLLDKPTEGRILLNGEDITDFKGEKLRQCRKHIQMVFQDHLGAFNPKMKIGDIITEPVVNFKKITRSERERLSEELLSITGLPIEFKDRFIHSLSGGQRQRVGIARAISLNPEVLICDEATSALDVSVQEDIINLLRKLQKERNLTIIFICHDIALVKNFTHRISVMYKGNIMETIASDMFVQKSCNPYTKMLIDSVFTISQNQFSKEEFCDEKEISDHGYENIGCVFSHRCKDVTEKCITEKPQLKEINNGHCTACHLIQ